MASEGPSRPFRFSIKAAELYMDTQHLAPQAFGCYMRLLLSYWRVGPPKNDDKILARIVGLDLAKWRAIRGEVAPFFDIQHDEWIHHELDRELSASTEAIRNNRERTKAATAARKAKAHRHDERNVVPTESVHAPGVVPVQPVAQARGGKDFGPGDFVGDISLAECALGIGGGA